MIVVLGKRDRLPAAEDGDVRVAAHPGRQPVLSRQIQKLERQLGVTLFERMSRNVALTNAGRQLVDEARPLLAAGDAARRGVRQAAEARPTLTVGFFIGDATVTRAIRAFRERRPEVTTQVRRIYWSDQAQVLLDGAADVAFVHLPIDERGLELVPLYAEERVALLAADHPLAGEPSISIAQLADDPVARTRARRTPGRRSTTRTRARTATSPRGARRSATSRRSSSSSRRARDQLRAQLCRRRGASPARRRHRAGARHPAHPGPPGLERRAAHAAGRRVRRSGASVHFLSLRLRK